MKASPRVPNIGENGDTGYFEFTVLQKTTSIIIGIPLKSPNLQLQVQSFPAAKKPHTVFFENLYPQL